MSAAPFYIVLNAGAGRDETETTCGVIADVLTAALYARFSSRDEGLFANRVLSAMRKQFGGHHEKSEP